MSFTSWLQNLPTNASRRVQRNRRRIRALGAATRCKLRFEALEDRMCLSSLPFIAPPTPADVASKARASAAYGQLPLSFEANQGQTDQQVDFLSRGSGYTLFLTPGEAVLSLAAGEANDVVRMRIVGADPLAPSAGLEGQSGRTNYLVGDDPSQWHTEVANYGRVEYQDVYSGIDLVYYGNQRRLEYDFVVAPGADPNEIRLAFDGMQSMELDAGGNLILHTAGGELVKDAPVLYQEIDGARHTIAGRYLLDDGQVRFEIGAYDRTLPLVIDPILSYSTYLGGKGNDRGYGIAVDSAGNAYIAGYTVATNFPTKNSWQAASAGGDDVFVTKLNSTGTGLIYSTYLGGSSSDWAFGIALDSSNNAYVTGWTVSTDFPTVNAYDATLSGTRDAFVAKLSSDGSALLYSTYLGGSSNSEEGQGIAVDGAGNAYVTGWTYSAASVSDFPTTPGAFQTVNPGRVDAFVTKLDTTASGLASLAYSTFLGGAVSDERAAGIAIDGSGSAYVTGYTVSSDFPIAPVVPGGVVLQKDFGGGMDAFVTKLNAAGSGLVYSTFLGGSAGDVGNSIALDKVTGEAYVLGSTNSANFPTKNPFQAQFGGVYDAFVSRLKADGSELVYSTYLGGSRWDGGDSLNPHYGIAVDAAFNAYVTGFTQSTNFPTKNPLPGQGALQSIDDAFVTKIDTSLTGAASLVFSTYFGGNDQEEGYAIAVDAAGNIYVTGQTQSTNNFPVTTGAFQSRKSTGDGIHVTEAFVAKIAPLAAAGPTLTINDVALVEGNSGTKSFVFTVSLSAASDQAVTVNYATANGTAKTGNNDYQAKSGMLTFAPGETVKFITIVVIGNKKSEANETFFLNLSGALNAIIDDGQGLGTILNDD